MANRSVPAELVDALCRSRWVAATHSVLVESSTGIVQRIDGDGRAVPRDRAAHPRGQLQWLPASRWPAPVHSWLGPRCLWWPHGIPRGRRVAFVSSRLGKPWDCHPRWFAALRHHLAKLDRRIHVLLAVERTTAAPAVRSAAHVTGVPLLWAEAGSDKVSFGDWWNDQLRREEHTASGIIYAARLSPPVTSTAGSEVPAPEPWLDAIPMRDRLLIALGQTLVVLNVRRGGKSIRLLDALLDSNHPNRDVLGMGSRRERMRDVAVARADHQPTAWQPTSDMDQDVRRRQRELPAVMAATFGAARRPPAPVGDLSDMPAADLPVHWTRRCAGPWPGESQDAYFEWLIRDDPPWDHSAWATLCRIVLQRRLIASAAAIRGKTPVVCFTAMPLAEVVTRRVFRIHRHRWDCEPYGICIRRSWLEQRGARPVRYGDDRLWSTLAQRDRPFFQQCRTRGSRPLVWQDEQEWRHVGDVTLDALSPEDGLVFVEHRWQAESLAFFCPWPLAVVGRTDTT